MSKETNFSRDSVWNCETAKRFIELYLDGELDVTEMRFVEQHLGSCGDCAMAVGRERLFRQRFADQMQRVRAPNSLADGIRAGISGRRPLTAFRNMAIAASVLVVLGVGLSVFVSLTKPGLEIDETPFRAVVAHAESSDSEVYGDRQMVQGFLTAKAPFESQIPVADNEGIRLIGARITSLGQRPAVVYMYDVGGRRVSVTQYHQDSQNPRVADTLKIERQGGFTAVTYPMGELVQTVVGEGSQDTVKGFIPASYSF